MNSIQTGIWLLIIVDQVFSDFLVYDQWSSVDYDYDSRRKQDDVRNSRLRPEQVVIYSAELHINGSSETLFVTTPNLFGASPFSLSTVSDKKSSDGGSLLVPYPDLNWYGGHCERSIISVYRVKVDKFNRLWVVDSGMVDQLTPNSSLICPPKILIFDLSNDNTLIKNYEIPNGQHYSDSLLVNIELEYRSDDPQDIMAYLSDVTGYRMVVYNLKEDESYPIDNPFFNPFPVYSFFRNVNGVNFTLLNGLYSVAIGAGSDKDRPVYFHSLSSARESAVNLSILSNSKLSKDAFSYDVSEVRGFHSSVEVMSPDGFLIFANIENNSIMVWDTKKPYKPRYFTTIAKDDSAMQFITGMQLMEGKKLLVTSSRYQNVLTGRIAKNQINYRVLINLDISKFLNRE